MNRMKWIVGCLALALAGAAQAQFTGSYQTNVVDGVSSNWTGHYYIGNGYSFDVLKIINGGSLTLAAGNNYGYLGQNNGDVGNTVLIDGANSTWNIQLGALVFMRSNDNSVIATNGGTLNGGAWGNTIAQNSGQRNRVVIAGSNSTWNAAGVNLNGGSNGRVLIHDGGALYSTGDNLIGNFGSGFLFEVAGARSYARFDRGLVVGCVPGQAFANNVFLIGVGGTAWFRDTANATNGIIVGPSSLSSGNKVQLDGGTLLVTNATSSTPGINVLNGALVLNSGLAITERLYLTNGTPAIMQFNGGSLGSFGTSVSNGAAFTVGNGASAATFDLAGGSHTFFNGLTVAANGALAIGGTNGIGAATLCGDVTLQTNGALDFDFSATTNDWLLVSGTVTLPATASLRVRAQGDSMRSPILVLQAGAISGDAAGWAPVAVGANRYYAAVVGNQLYLNRVPTGTVIMIR